MPLDCLVVPIGFEESLVDLDSVSSTYDNTDVEWTVSELDSETLSALERENMNKKQSSESSDRSSWCRNRSRRVSVTPSRRSQLSLWTPRHRLRDERKRIVKLSLAKLQVIDDPETCLRRSVLLSNTLRGLQRQIREEKALLRQQNQEQEQKRPVDEKPVECSRNSSSHPPVAACQTPSASDSSADASASKPRVKRRRLSDSSDSTEHDSGTADAARSRPALRPCNSNPAANPASLTTPTFTGLSCLGSGFSGLVSSYDVDKQQQQYSCGHSSLFGELQSVVFHSLITSLES